MKKIVTIVGARPQFIKAATVSRALAEYNKTCLPESVIREVLVHTGQHYDDNMSRVFFTELHIPQPDYNLEIGSGSHGQQSGKMLMALEKVLVEEKPDLVLVYGDTNSTLAGVLAAAKLHVPSAHVEAGLRSFNRRMPEEINRIVADQLGNILFSPTPAASDNLRREGIAVDPLPDQEPLAFDINAQLAFQVGDVMYDSVIFYESLAKDNSEILDNLGLTEKNYSLATVHRAENTDDPENLKNIMQAFASLATAGHEIVLPLHPRTKKCFEALQSEAGFSWLGTLKTEPSASLSRIRIVEPVGYLDMIQLEKNAAVIFTDSGGVQKEAFFLQVPCITLRRETEWVETVECGRNILVGADRKKIIAAFDRGVAAKKELSPFGLDTTENDDQVYGNGQAAECIVEIISRLLYN